MMMKWRNHTIIETEANDQPSRMGLADLPRFEGRIQHGHGS
jgi:hypothetical protein